MFLQSPFKKKKVVSLSPPLPAVFKFNAYGASNRVLQVLEGLLLHNNRGEVLIMFSNFVGAKDSNEAELSVIQEAMCVFSSSL